MVPPLISIRPIYHEKIYINYRSLSIIFGEISENVQECPITFLPVGRQGLSADYTDTK
jgi:hypothetical protein